MTKQISKQITYWLGIVSIGLVVGLGIQFAQAAWTNPTYPLPIQNVEAPVNVSGNTQTKAGDLIVDDFGTNTITTTGNFKVLTNGNVGIGTTTPSVKLDVAGDIKAASGDITGYLTAGGFCIGSSCVNAWPAGGTAWLGYRHSSAGEQITCVSPNGGSACSSDGKSSHHREIRAYSRENNGNLQIRITFEKNGVQTKDCGWVTAKTTSCTTDGSAYSTGTVTLTNSGISPGINAVCASATGTRSCSVYYN